MKERKTLTEKMKGNKHTYQITDATLSSLLFVLFYNKMIHEQVTGVQWFILTWIAMVATGFVGNALARVIVQYWKSHFSFRNLNRTLINTLIYTMLIVSGLIEYIFENYPMFSITAINVVLILFIIKLVTFVFADFFAAKIK